jgi:hypothetical protein
MSPIIENEQSLSLGTIRELSLDDLDHARGGDGLAEWCVAGGMFAALITGNGTEIDFPDPMTGSEQCTSQGY